MRSDTVSIRRVEGFDNKSKEKVSVITIEVKQKDGIVLFSGDMSLEAFQAAITTGLVQPIELEVLSDSIDWSCK